MESTESAKTEDNNNGGEGEKTQVDSAEKPKKSVRFCTPQQALIYDNVVHYRQESVFTKYSEDLKLDGFKNFIYLILIISCSRLAFENLSSYGFKANPFRWVDYIMWDPLSRPTFFLFLALHAFILFALILEKCYVSYLYGNQRAQKFADGTTQFETTNKEETIFQVIYLINLASMLALPVVISQVFHCNPFLLSFICLIYSATCLKIFSFHQVNSWWRTGKIYGRTYEELPNLSKLESKVEDYVENILKPQKEKGSQLILYPQNLNIANVVYYFYVPTLCYQLNFPRTKNINWYFVLRCLLEFLFLIELETVLFEQWIIVPLQQQQFTLDELSVHQFILKWTKMSIGTISIWLICFYALFQSGCNLGAELFRFADRDFYGDWWNAVTLSQFWNRWNRPVHLWCLRHLYKPLLIGGYSKVTTAFVIFFISGIFHEFLVSVPLGMFSIHFIVGMTLQMVLELATAHVHKTSKRLANVIVWFSLCLGQSALILLYYNDIMLKIRRETVVTVVDGQIV